MARWLDGWMAGRYHPAIQLQPDLGGLSDLPQPVFGQFQAGNTPECLPGNLRGLDLVHHRRP
ncbi:MAG: hypothetical protein ACE5HA_19210 [Anaerolineae bacterium]